VPPEADGRGRRKVVIVGGGFGGGAAARALRGADLAVTLVDRTNHHLFQPLLYQVAAGSLSEGECAATIRTMLRRHSNTTVLMAEVTDIDAATRRVVLDTGEQLDYDSLILAGGAETSYFGHEEWAAAAPGLKTLADAVGLRDRIFGAFEQAERATEEAAREEWLGFVVVGGGPTGVEISGQLAILASTPAGPGLSWSTPASDWCPPSTRSSRPRRLKSSLRWGSSCGRAPWRPRSMSAASR
jgi:NADH dehydrogenase